MSTPLLKTKLYAPPTRSELISRPHLVERLGDGFRGDHKLTLVSAPAGYGKTTLLGEWIARSELGSRVAWVSLDEGDNDPARFWAYVVAALQSVEAGIGDVAQAAFQSPRPPPIESLLTSLLNQVAEVPDPLVLVLDDYHTIHTPAIHTALTFLLENIPPHMHLVLATRADPPLPLSRLRGRGQLNELYQSDLRFASGEIAQFLDLVLNLRLSAEDAAALETRTEGWIAGLQMAAISMRGRDAGGISEFVRAFAGSHRFILDYLGEEVFRRQGPAVQEFLLQTAVLDRLCGELCQAVLGAGESTAGATGPDAQSMLEHLEHNNLFVVPLDDERHWYRYHRLFADLLRRRLRQERRDMVPQLHRRASEWYSENGMVREAVIHTLAAEDLKGAADLIERAAWTMLSRGECTTLLGWLDSLPDGLTRSRPRLGVSRAWALAFSNRMDGIESCLADIDAEHVQSEVAAVRAYAASVRGDVPRTIELAQQAYEGLPAENLFLRGAVAQTLGIAYWTRGDLTAASRAMGDAVALNRTAGETYLTLFATASLGHIQEMQGLLHRAADTHREALELAGESGSRPVPFAGVAHVGLAEVLYEWNDLDGAMRHAQEGARLSALGGRLSSTLAGRRVLALAYCAQGDVGKALETIQEVESAAQRAGHGEWIRIAEATRSRLWLERGDIAAAFQWADERRGKAADGLGVALAHELEQIAVARVLIACNSSQGPIREAESEGTLRLLARLAAAADAAGRIGSVIQIRALQALAYAAGGDLEQALPTLGRALSLGEPEGYVRTFLDEGQPMAGLLRLALSRGVAPNYAARLLGAFGDEDASSPSAMESLVEPLSEREIEVLRLIVAGLSNPEIAEELVIAVSTVKSHINHVYGKLGATSRTQAAATARELGLI